MGMGLNLYDVMAVERLRGRRCAARGASADVEATGWSPDRHRVDRRRARSSSGCRRSAPREPTAGYLFYDCQTDDAASC